MNDKHQRARKLVLTHGWNAVAYQLLNPGFSLWFSRAGDAVAGYVVRSGRWVVAGAPVCASERLPSVIEEFEADAAAERCGVCYFGAAIRLYEGCKTPPRHSVVLLGSQPVWNPQSWNSIIASRASVRAQLNRARNKGVVVTTLTDDPEVTVAELRPVLQAWLESRRMPPMHFLVEPDTLSFLEDRLVLVARVEASVVGYLVASPIAARHGWLVEQIIRSPAAPNGTNELLLHCAMQLFMKLGAEYATLGLVPLARHEAGSEVQNPLWMKLLFAWVRAHGRRFYNFEGLEAFKSKFAPDEWEPIYAIATEPAFSLKTLWAIAAAFSHQKSPVIHGSHALWMAAMQEVRQKRKSSIRYQHK